MILRSTRSLAIGTWCLARRGRCIAGGGAWPPRMPPPEVIYLFADLERGGRDRAAGIRMDMAIMAAAVKLTEGQVLL